MILSNKLMRTFGHSLESDHQCCLLRPFGSTDHLMEFNTMPTSEHDKWVAADIEDGTFVVIFNYFLCF